MNGDVRESRHKHAAAPTRDLPARAEHTAEVVACDDLRRIRHARRIASTLLRGLYAALAPGGTLYVANMVPSNPTR